MIFKRVENIREVSWKLIYKSVHVIADRLNNYHLRLNKSVGSFTHLSLLSESVVLYHSVGTNLYLEIV